MPAARFSNPFRPGAGHMPPYLAGRDEEQKEFARLLKQDPIVENLVLTGLRGVGKTVLLETLKPIAVQQGWVWVGTDLSESASVSEENMGIRLMTDLAVVTSSWVAGVEEHRGMGFRPKTRREEVRLTYDTLRGYFEQTPGLAADKIKAVLELAWRCLPPDRAGVMFAYDEAQILSDQSASRQYPLSVLLDVFQSIQRKGVRFMLALTGLPTLFPKLVEARTYAERMFRVVFLNKLDDHASAQAIRKPTEKRDCPIKFSPQSIRHVIDMSGGYPYFIQFVCREIFDVWVQALEQRQDLPAIPVREITRKLDTDFFAGRWARATDRQRDLLAIIAALARSEQEFTVQEVVEQSRVSGERGFSPSHTSQMLWALCEHGLIYKNRHGRYSFAVPLFAQFIRRQISE